MRHLGTRAALQVDCPVAVVNCDYCSGALLRSGVANFQRPINGVVLWREAVAVDYGLLDSADFSNIDQAAKRTLVLLQFVVRQVAKPEIFPPRRFFLSAMPFQQLR